MPLPKPTPGLVICFDYVWSGAGQGRVSRKNRPACIVAAVTRGDLEVIVTLPITHSPPQESDVAIPLPATTRARLGLDDAPSWMVLSEHNVSRWPYDVATLPGRPDTFAYGMLPPSLFKQIRDAFLALYKRGKSSGVKR